MLEEVSQREGAVVLRNCTLELYQGKHIRLAVTKWGKLSVYPDNVASTPPPPSKMNVDRNFSLIDLSIVASEMVDTSPSSESRYSARQGKGTENDQSGSGTGTSKTPSSKSGQSTPKYQQSQSSKRGNKSGERRQSRGKAASSGPMTAHYGGIKPDSRQQPQPGQVMYHTMPGYPTFDQTMGMRQYPHSYTHASRQEVSAQQMLLQQYELQQRQLQQMYGQEHHRQGHQVQQSPQMMIRPMDSFEGGSTSYAGDVADQHQVPLMSGASPLMMPMGIPPGQSIPQEHYSSPSLESPSAPADGSHPSQRAGAMSPYTIGKMNPEASTYTPSYLSAAQGKPAYQRK
jgi:replication factor A1